MTNNLSDTLAALSAKATYDKPEHGWTCFHCGETFTTPGSARDHFGFDPSFDPACRIKNGAERGLVMALRKAENDCDELRHLLHDEASEAYRLYAAQTARHRAQIMAAEEAGYERGLADGRAEANRAGQLVPVPSVVSWATHTCKYEGDNCQRHNLHCAWPSCAVLKSMKVKP